MQLRRHARFLPGISRPKSRAALAEFGSLTAAIIAAKHPLSKRACYFPDNRLPASPTHQFCQARLLIARTEGTSALTLAKQPLCQRTTDKRLTTDFTALLLGHRADGKPMHLIYPAGLFLHLRRSVEFYLSGLGGATESGV